MTTVRLPRPDGTFTTHTLDEPKDWGAPAGPPTSRVAFAAAHVVADPFADNTPGAPAQLDWDATLSFRRRLWDLGFGVAEAMDTAQRGMGLDWPTALELIRRSAAEATGRIAAGVGTDHDTADPLTAYTEQLEAVTALGVQPILMCSRKLAAVARGPEDYQRVYAALLEQVTEPVILHWLGPAFDPALTGYWGSTDVAEATKHFLDLIHTYLSKVDGVKVSLLDAGHEVSLRRALPDGVRCYTGDDYNYPELIAGDDVGHSDALLGIFDPIAPAAASALHVLDSGDAQEFRAILEPTVALSRHIFGAPTFHYKTGVVFLAWLNGFQDAWSMVGGMQSARSLVHLGETLRLADAAGLLVDPALAAARWEQLVGVLS
ncbi:dihydrodipicolinate synthase family protein [Saccharothrix sp.]|uniref:dihydrodipicolinate synthase family protein n=1 Tax=Saccharothrix sp. TaxID=1873460 RepID=UPI002811943E|nr:dihydrodipicolinate synthase family protein [Saccharothrix sp.]